MKSSSTELPNQESPPIPVFQMQLTWSPMEGKFSMEGPMNMRHVCYEMLELAREQLILLAVKQETNRIIPAGGILPFGKGGMA